DDKFVVNYPCDYTTDQRLPQENFTTVIPGKHFAELTGPYEGEEEEKEEGAAKSNLAQSNSFQPSGWLDRQVYYGHYYLRRVATVSIIV
ncbi:hypothetical protein TYRP_001333, partial [Tyrophagus putrescentiae]